MLGGTEYVAEACEETLNQLGHQSIVHLDPHFEEISDKYDHWLVCTSTHGAGDVPDNIQEFVSDLTNTDRDLNYVKFLVIGIGDSNYDTFCYAAKAIESLLLSKGCTKLVEPLLLDMSEDIDPEDLAQAWITKINDQL